MNAACTVTAPNNFGNAMGWYVQSGYYLIPRTVELSGRFAYLGPGYQRGRRFDQRNRCVLELVFERDLRSSDHVDL